MNVSQVKDKKKVITIAVICVILLMNVVWTIAQNKFTPKLDEVKNIISGLEKRIEKLEQGGFSDMADLKNDFEAMKAISAQFSERAAESLKAEEDQLKYLESQVEAQKAKVEAMKKLSQ
ncbi:MAG: hypothetical protein IJM82_04110 [Synergistaceae bacterium]|nr:hypothetical protein [Synergistaceae bacterium]MBQ7068328.1 hypothetical protein [Synergistaceae bacterium]MBR0079562.1 hypothetical protein [Synergistaceae bacterium]